MNLEIYANVLNLLNTKEILNVYPDTGVPTDDGWLKTPSATQYKAIPNYTAFYNALNLQNRWGIMTYGANVGMGDTYGTPRQIRVGVRMEL